MTPVADTRPLLTGIPTEVCRVTVAGPAKRADLAIPVSATLGELLPLVLRHTVDAADRDGAWVLQRLGGPPLDPGATPESLDVRDGEVLYLNPEHSVLPESQFDDLGVGVAHAVNARRDQWRPEFTRRLLVGLAGVPLAAIAAFGIGLTPHVAQLVCLTGTAIVLTAVAISVSRLLDGGGAGLLTGLSACGFAVLAGLAGRHGVHGILQPDRHDVQLAGASAAFVASTIASACQLPIDPFGVVAGTGFAAAVGGALAGDAGWDAATAAAVLACMLFVLTMNVRFVLRAARLRVPQLPHTAEELQQDIDPEPEESVARRTGVAVSYLNSLYITASLVFTVTFALLVRAGDGYSAAFAADLAAAVLLRTRSLTLAWQRVPLAVCGTAGVTLVAASSVAHASAAARALAILAFAIASGVLLAVARRPMHRRPLAGLGPPGRSAGDMERDRRGASASATAARLCAPARDDRLRESRRPCRAAATTCRLISSRPADCCTR